MIARCPGTPGSPHTSSRLAPLYQRVPAVRAVCLDAPRTEVRYGEPQLRQDARTNDHRLSAELIRPNARSISKDHLSPPQAGSVRPGNSGTRLAQLISARSSPARSDAVQQGLWVPKTCHGL